jgi:ketosteroid isomerase-like protein
MRYSSRGSHHLAQLVNVSARIRTGAFIADPSIHRRRPSIENNPFQSPTTPIFARMKSSIVSFITLLGLATTTFAQADARGFVDRFYAAYASRDATKLIEFYADDAEFIDPTFDLNLKGRAQIQALFTAALAKYETLAWTVQDLIVSGDRLVVVGEMQSRLFAKNAGMKFISVLTVRDGKITRQQDMFDLIDFYVQLGAVPPQFAPLFPKPPAPAQPKGN